MCKMVISPRGFFNFSKFWFSECLGVGQRAKNGPERQKNVCLTLYLRNCTSYDLHLWYKSVKG